MSDLLNKKTKEQKQDEYEGCKKEKMLSLSKQSQSHKH